MLVSIWLMKLMVMNMLMRCAVKFPKSTRKMEKNHSVLIDQLPGICGVNQVIFPRSRKFAGSKNNRLFDEYNVNITKYSGKSLTTLRAINAFGLSYERKFASKYPLMRKKSWTPKRPKPIPVVWTRITPKIATLLAKSMPKFLFVSLLVTTRK